MIITIALASAHVCPLSFRFSSDSLFSLCPMFRHFCLHFYVASSFLFASQQLILYQFPCTQLCVCVCADSETFQHAEGESRRFLTASYARFLFCERDIVKMQINRMENNSLWSESHSQQQQCPVTTMPSPTSVQSAPSTKYKSKLKNDSERAGMEKLLKFSHCKPG